MPTVTVEIPTSLKIALDRETARVGGDESTVVTAALAEHLGTPVHTLFQISTSGALVAGVYSRAVSVETILDHGDHYMHLADLRPYLEADARLVDLYADADAWNHKAILNIAGSGKFSSDRTIAQYAAEVWDAKPCPVA